ncbi:MAG: glycosyltransferase [Solobacterium sp.]|jgi:GT2 family glycosyltransferase|nr:glycosyltransferase [Solobacterium sp.]MCH4049503.1 glycosyltransferase [Solobacterium sp.]MCH4075361.1 glycosyltransferase [Solobacterium sp.]
MYGIVILNYNSYLLTCNLVKKLVDFNKVGKIVIVDNNSNDDFSEFIKSMNCKKLIYIKSKKNSGYAAGNNIGLRYLYNHGYEYAFIANPDVEFAENTTDQIYNFLLKNDNYAVASCKRTIGKNGRTGQFWNLPNYWDCLIESVYSGRKWLDSKYKNNFDIVWSDTTSLYYDVEVVGGAFFGCNLNAINEIGYLNEHTFLWYEENILAFNLKKNGYKESLLLKCSYEHNHIRKRHGNNKHGIYLHSKRVYCYECLRINIAKKMLLSIFDFIGYFESKLIYIIASLIKSN